MEEKKISQIIKDKRLELGYSLMEVARQTGISYVSLYQLENKEKLLHIENLSKVCQVLNLNYDEIYDIYKKEREKK